MAMSADQEAIRRKIIYNTKKLSDYTIKKRIEKIEKQLLDSIKIKSLRKKNLPELIYNHALPIVTRKDEKPGCRHCG